VIIAYPPGGVDNQVRLLTPSLEKYLGQPWIIDYRPGAGGQIGQEFVARSAPDGYTLFGTVCNSWIILPALLGGQVPIGFITYSVSKGFLAGGKWKLIGVTNTEPNSRAMAPAGVEFVSDVVPGFEASPQWLGFGGPAGLPRPIVTRLHDAITRALGEPGIVEKYLEDRQVNYGKVSIEEFERRVREDFARVRKSVQEAGIPPQE